MREAYKAFCNFFSQSAYDVNATWPFYSLPNFELHARTILKQTGAEILNVVQYIKDKDAVAALSYVEQNYEKWTTEGHMTRYGNIDRLTPAKYHPYFTLATPEGRVQDTKQREQHYGMWQFSPRK
jgi:hypothetical protein